MYIRRKIITCLWIDDNTNEGENHFMKMIGIMNKYYFILMAQGNNGILIHVMVPLGFLL